MLSNLTVGLLGLGTVGGGTVNVLLRNQQEIARRAGCNLKVTCASIRDVNKERICTTDGMQLTVNPLEIIKNPDVNIVVELVGGVEQAFELVIAAIKQCKHVITANKALIAQHGNEIFALANAHGVNVAFEAAVAGGIPIIKIIREGLSGNHIQCLTGILNGTSNYILTEMRDKQRDFADVLVEAKHLGYAEADPTFDIEGIDVTHKLAILSSVAFGIPLQCDKIYCEGISKITPLDIEYAASFGFGIKHIALARRHQHSIELRAHPALIPQQSLMTHVDGAMNAVLIDSDALGPSLYYGAGAGADPTASAVVADIVDVARSLTTDPKNRVPHLAFQMDAISDIPITSIDTIETCYYLRMVAADQAGVLAQITAILSKQAISIESLLQKDQASSTHVQVVILTHRVVEKAMRAAVRAIENLSGIIGDVTMIRLECL